MKVTLDWMGFERAIEITDRDHLPGTINIPIIVPGMGGVLAFSLYQTFRDEEDNIIGAKYQAEDWPGKVSKKKK